MHLATMHHTKAMFTTGLLPEAWAMRQHQFEAQAICAGVDPVMIRAQLLLQASDEEAEQALARLQELASRAAPDGAAEPNEWAAAGVRKLLGQVFADDVFVSKLDGIAHVVLFKKAQLPEGMSTSELLRRVHMRLVEEAVSAGEPVPDDVLEEYRASMERMHVLASTAQREVFH